METINTIASWLYAHLTTDRIILLCVIAQWVAIRWPSGRVAAAVTWAKSAAPGLFEMIEGMEQLGMVPKAGKPAEFMRRLEDAYRRQHGTALPAAAADAARAVAAGLSASDKEGRSTLPPILTTAAAPTPADPQPAPGA